MISRDKLKPGDHIYTWRTLINLNVYGHHGIYVGEEMVIQLTNAVGRGSGTPLDLLISSSPPSSSATGISCPKCGYHSGLGGVLSSCIDCFLNGGDLCLFEYDVSIPYFLSQPRGGTCSTLSSDSPEEVLHRAYYLLENCKDFGGYNLFERNCEDFAIYCKTGRILINGTLTNRVGLKTVFLLFASFAAGGSFGLRFAEIRMRENAQKIPVETLVSQYLSK